MINNFACKVCALAGPLFFACLLASSQQPVRAGLTLEKEFFNPPVSARPKALWPWTNGNFSLSQITYELEEARKRGMGGFDIWDIGTQIDPDSVIPAGPPFLSRSSVDAIAHTIREADRLGLEIGLTFSSSWNAGGSWVKPEHSAMGLFRSDTILRGPLTFSAPLPFPDLPETYNGSPTMSVSATNKAEPDYYREVAVLAYPLQPDSLIERRAIIKLSAAKNGRIKWKVPTGRWRIVRYVCAPTGQPLAIPSPLSKGLLLDHFSADAQRKNIGYIFDQLLPVTGDLKGRSLKYLYADSYEVNSAVWTPSLPEAFAIRNSYSLETYLPVLDGFTVNNDEESNRFLYDFRKTLSDLIIENHYKLGTELCAEKGIGFCAEAGGPGQPIHNVPFEDIKALGALTIPRGEFWRKHDLLESLQIVKGIASAAHIYDQKFVEAESFTSVWLWQEGPDELKPLADRAMCEGLNRFVYHTFPHTPQESGFPGWVYNFGTLINTTNGWWPKSDAFHHYLARCSYLLQQGKFVGDVAYYYGDEAPNFVPPKHTDPRLGHGYDYDVVNSEAILTKMSVRDGRIYLPHGQYYEVLVLPQSRRMNVDVLRKIEELVAGGAVVIGPRPQTSTGLHQFHTNDSLVRNIAERVWGNCDSTHVAEHKYKKGKVVWGRSIREVLIDKNVFPDVQTRHADIDFIHRQTDDAEIYFLRNKSKRSISDAIEFRVQGKYPEIWDAETGDVIAVRAYKKTENGVALPLTFASEGSCFVVFRKVEKVRAQDSLVLDKLDVYTDTAEFQLYHSKAGLVSNSNGKYIFKQNGTERTSEVNLPASLTLNGPWFLRFEQQHTGVARDTMQTIIPLNESPKERVKYYSGPVTYQTEFDIDSTMTGRGPRILLDLGSVNEIAEVFVNGTRLAVLWHAPFKTDITAAVRKGKNALTVEVVNTINNLLIYDAKKPKAQQRLSSNVRRLPNAWMKPFAEAPLLDAGMSGPVRLTFEQVVLE